MPLGLFCASKVWNIFIISIVALTAPLEAPPDDLQQHVAKMLPRAGHGPGSWCRTEDLLHVHRKFGFSGEFKDPYFLACAAMFRTATWRTCSRAVSLTRSGHLLYEGPMPILASSTALWNGPTGAIGHR